MTNELGSPLTCDRCMHTPAMVVLVLYPPARYSARVVRLLCGSCEEIDAKDCEEARWQHVTVPLAVPERPGAVLEVTGHA